ncbi:DNA-directed RNA polymerase subunit H [Candidatus Woesearchaeota archaeon]|nr:DNA-directed RNA polymerase subunit H [Candidatus Woesearchaeota archaeon]
MAKKKFQTDKHSLIPKHVKLSDVQKKKMLEEFNAAEQDLPKITKNDPAVLSLKAKPGEVIKITRNSMTAGESIFYRVVVDV